MLYNRLLCAYSLLLVGVAFSFSFPDPAFAASGGSGLPWEGPLQQIQASLTGPVATSIALIAIVVTGSMLIFGGELGDFARRLCYVVLALGVILGATNIVGLFGASGASIGEAPASQSDTVNIGHLND